VIKHTTIIIEDISISHKSVKSIQLIFPPLFSPYIYDVLKKFGTKNLVARFVILISSSGSAITFLH